MKVKYKDLKTKNKANKSHIDMAVEHTNCKNKLEEVAKIQAYLLGKYGTLEDISHYSIDDTNLFIDYMTKLQGYSERFICRVYKIDQKIITKRIIDGVNANKIEQEEKERLKAGQNMEII